MPESETNTVSSEQRVAGEDSTRFTAVNSAPTGNTASGSTIVVGNNRASAGPGGPATSKVVSAVEDWQETSESLTSHKRKRSPEAGQDVQPSSPRLIAVAAQGNILAGNSPATALMHQSPHPNPSGSISESILGADDDEMGGLGDDNMSEHGHDDDRSQFVIRGTEGSPSTPGQEVGDKKRKRQFANRTKTGCITCRRRKKKCDEGKPECVNCKRGGFVCEGYTTKVSWPKAQNKTTTPVSIQSKYDAADLSASPSPAVQGGVLYVAREQPLLNTIDEQGRPLPSGPLVPFATGPAVANADPDSDKYKMLNGQPYSAYAPELVAERDRCKAACYHFNNALMLNASKGEQWRKFIEILRPGGQYEGMPLPLVTGVDVETPFHCTYGTNISIGRGVKIGAGCNIDDAAHVTIKDRTIIDQDVKIYTSLRNVDPRKRQGGRGPEYAKPVIIEEDCWIGGNVTILPGVTIARGTVVGTGSVVSKDAPPYTIVAGNPASVLRGIYANGVDT